MEEFYPRPFPYEIPLSEYEILCKLVWAAFGHEPRPSDDRLIVTPKGSPWDDDDVAEALARASREQLLEHPDLINDFDVHLLTVEAKKHFAPALMLSVSRHQEGSGYGPRSLGLVNRKLDESSDLQEATLAMEGTLEPYSTLQQIAFGKYMQLYARMDDEVAAWRSFWKQRYMDALQGNYSMLEEHGFDVQELLESAIEA